MLKSISGWNRKSSSPLRAPGPPLLSLYIGMANLDSAINYHKLNSVTIPDEFPIPCQSEILQALLGVQVLSMLVALAGFNQLSIADEDREKMGIRSHQGLHQFKQLPFGLCNGPLVFQRVMQGIPAPFLWIFSLVYINDIVVYSQSYKEHLMHLDKVQVLQAVKERPGSHFPQRSVILPIL